MNNKLLKLKTILKIEVIIMIIIVIFIDSDFLNDLIIKDYSIDNQEIEEIAYSITEDNSSNNKEQVVVNNEEIVNQYATTLNVASNDYWAWPTESNYVITSYYGYRWGSMHNAIDISGTGYGSNIYAANNGVVITANGGCIAGNLSCNGRGGNYIIIKHTTNDYYTIYMHLKDIKVSVGDIVSRGQVIGTMGNTGNVSPAPQNSYSTAGTHLHFALYIGEPYKGGYAINPLGLY